MAANAILKTRKKWYCLNQNNQRGIGSIISYWFWHHRYNRIIFICFGIILTSVPAKAFALEPIWTFFLKFERLGQIQNYLIIFSLFSQKLLGEKLTKCWANCAPYSLSRNTDLDLQNPRWPPTPYWKPLKVISLEPNVPKKEMKHFFQLSLAKQI